VCNNRSRVVGVEFALELDLRIYVSNVYRYKTCCTLVKSEVGEATKRYASMQPPVDSSTLQVRQSAPADNIVFRVSKPHAAVDVAVRMERVDRRH
jgi:hypothetical protein